MRKSKQRAGGFNCARSRKITLLAEVAVELVASVFCGCLQSVQSVRVNYVTATEI